MANDENDELHTDKELDVDAWDYDVKPKYVRFRLELPDGEKYLTLDEAMWNALDSQFHQTIHRAKPITDQDLTNVLQRLQSMRSWANQFGTRQEQPPVMLVNMAKRADGHGYILRVYETRQDREWNITTMGELEALERAVGGRG